MNEEFFEEVDEDIEFSEEDFISEEDLEDEINSQGEAFAFPFTSIYINKLPDKFNPIEIFRKKELILYNPNEKITPYNTVIPEALTFDLLKNNFIIQSISSDQNSSLAHLAAYSKILNNGLKNIVNTYTSYIESKEEPENNDNSPKNGMGKKPFKPKPQNAQGRKYYRKYKKKGK